MLPCRCFGAHHRTATGKASQVVPTPVFYRYLRRLMRLLSAATLAFDGNPQIRLLVNLKLTICARAGNRAGLFRLRDPEPRSNLDAGRRARASIRTQRHHLRKPAQSQTHLVRQKPCLLQSAAGLQDSTRSGGGGASTGTDHPRTGAPQRGRNSRELPHMGCSTPFKNSQKHSAWLAGGRASVPAAVASARKISRVGCMSAPISGRA
jgi:hypothetical protein